MSNKTTPIDTIITVLFCIAGVILLPITIIWLIATYNNFKSLKIKVEESNSGIDVALTKRFDVLTKAMNVAKGYAKHEKETLTDVISVRGGMSMAQKQEANEKMNQMEYKINVLREQYPDLKADTIFRDLQKSIIDVEEHLQASRRLYNSNVTIFNNMQQRYPTRIIADLMHLESQEFFTAEQRKREDVDMTF